MKKIFLLLAFAIVGMTTYSQDAITSFLGQKWDLPVTGYGAGTLMSYTVENQNAAGNAGFNMVVGANIAFLQLDGSGNLFVINRTGDISLLPAGGDVNMSTNNLLLTGSIASTGSRVTKGWFTNLEVTNAPTVGGSAVYYVGGTDVALADGGTGASLTASNGGIFYSTAAAGAILSGTAVANRALLAGSGAAPAWSTATYPPTTTINQILYSSAANTIAGLATGNSGLLVTGGTGIPSIATDIPTAVTIGAAYIYRVSGTDVADADVVDALTISGGTVNNSIIGGTTPAAGTFTVSTIGLNGTTGILNLFSEQGGTDYTASLYPNAAMTSAASFYLPTDEPAADRFMLMTSGGIFKFTGASAALAASLSDETGTLKSVFSDSPTFTTDIATPQITLGGTTATGIINGTAYTGNLANSTTNGDTAFFATFQSDGAAGSVQFTGATSATIATTTAGVGLTLDAADATAGTAQEYIVIPATIPVHAANTPTDIILDINPTIGNPTVTTTLNLIDLTYTTPAYTTNGVTNNVRGINITPTTGASDDGTQTISGIRIAPVLGNASTGTHTLACIDIPTIVGETQTSLYGLRIGNLFTNTAATENAINIGSLWDLGINDASGITTTGAFTSVGIDDNANANAITIDITTEEVNFTADIDVGDDIFMSNLGVINWNTGDMTLTHSANLLTLGGGAFTVNSNAANTSAIMTIQNTAGDFQIFRTDATPESAVTGSIGDMAVDGTGGVLYFKQSGSASNTGWQAVGGTPTYKSYSLSNPGNSGTFYVGGHYAYDAADANLTIGGAVTQTFGTAGEAHGSHAFCVAAGAGGADLVLTVTGVSITDAGVKNDTDSEIIVADADAATTDEYFETSKKWLGQITYTLTGAAGSFDFNYGFVKYEDFGNRDFTITDFEGTGECRANETGLNIELLYHEATAFIYDAAAFIPNQTALISLATDYGTNNDVANGDGFAYKRTGLTTAVNGDSGEGLIIRVTTAVNNSINDASFHVGVTLK